MADKLNDGSWDAVDRPGGRGDQRRSASDKTYRDAELALSAIEDMMDSGKFSWAADTLHRFTAAIEEHMQVPAGIRRSLNNIRDSRGWPEWDR